MERKKFIRTLSMLAFSGPAVWAACTRNNELLPETGLDNNCEVTTAEIAGPFPTIEPTSYIRSDIKKGDGLGVDMQAFITILDVNAGCSALEGALVDIWHCDVDGNYSQYGGMEIQEVDYQSENWYRGRQVTNAEGKVTFQTIFPGWYSTRSTHIHVHIYDASGRSLLITQIAFQDSLSIAVNSDGSAYGYTKGISGYIYNADDSVFGDGFDKEMSTVTGSLTDGFELDMIIRVEA